MTPAPTTWTARALQGLGRALCGLRGHDQVLAFGERRVMLRCATCGHETPGWVITGGPRQRFAGDPRRHELHNGRLHVLRLRRRA